MGAMTEGLNDPNSNEPASAVEVFMAMSGPVIDGPDVDEMPKLDASMIDRGDGRGFARYGDKYHSVIVP
jgi:hypothetical protein